jgi:sulfate transport system substrate-binding protein
VEDVARKHGTTEVATEYLKYLYSKEGQELVAKNFYRPADKDIAAKYAQQFPKLELVNIQQFGGWDKAQETHFADEGVFDQIYGR